MPRPALHQFTEGVYAGDAVSDQVFIIQRWLREMGFASEVFAERIQPELEGQARPAREYRPDASECVIHHHAVGSDIAERLSALALPQILIYHNITPPQYFAFADPIMASQLVKGRRQLEEMCSRTLLALGDSGYNERELRELGYSRTGALPIVLDESRYREPVDMALAAECDKGRPLVLFVGRFAPNKRQEDLIKLLYCLRRLSPQARLVLAGNTSFEAYVAWQKEFAGELGLDESAVHFAGHVSQREMITYYRYADVYVSMSEHEGFGKPLIESMYFGLPVIAYGSTAVPDTMGDAGIIFYQKHYEALAELVHMVATDDALRRRLIARQTKRVKAFLEPQVRRQWASYLREIGLIGDNYR